MFNFNKSTAVKLSALAICLVQAACSSTPVPSASQTAAKAQSTSTTSKVSSASCCSKPAGGAGKDELGTAVDKNAVVPVVAEQAPAPTLLGRMKDEAEKLVKVFYFDYDQSSVKAEDLADISNHATFMNKYPQTAVRLTGHADARGGSEYNMALGNKRAQSVLNSFAAGGVDKSRIETRSFGKEKPAVEGTTEAAYSKNRRVEVEYFVDQK